MSGLAIASLAITVGTTTNSFIQAGKQKRLARDAERAAAMAMAEVEKELTKNEMEALSVNQLPYEIEKMKNEAQLKSQLMAQEFEYNQQLRDISEQALANREVSREDAKSSRISQQNSEQSKLINQRKNNLPPQTFESNEDSLDGFDLAEFDPR